MSAMSIGWGELLLVIIALLFPAIGVVAMWRILARLGLPPAMGILILFPIVNMALLYYVAHTRWPAIDTNRP